MRFELDEIIMIIWLKPSSEGGLKMAFLLTLITTTLLQITYHLKKNFNILIN